ncbi:sigma-54 interaction domain-containing protein [Desulfoluna spongiiphila]|uniref:sigma-54 interaction domain-containing protein n=1 Tax=Desulfoluna spongiiphila TaxID=419481 RepID=UPI0012513C13|nr:sigma 54-interacting transcriptional regulator [Desulfoluna spongiiphila]VVS91762.1 consensus disorder prediction [Desulfoluna spongiiphila]
MDLYDMTFFGEATNRICGSLDIHTALDRCFHHLKDHMPINGIAMNTYDPEKKEVGNIAIVSDLDNNRILSFDPVKLTPEAISFIENFPPTPGPALILNVPNQQVVADLVWKAMGKPEISLLLLHPIVDEVRLGVVFIFAEGFDRYEPEHSRLLTLLHDPFAMAFSNTLKHREVVRLTEMLADDNRYLTRELHHLAGDKIIGSRQGLKHVTEMVRQVAPLSSQVLLLGETGVGKEVIANAIHCASPRANKPFIKVNCGAIPDELIDSELFGHERGAFTGALQKKRGRFERADTGTIFLDEIGELPPQAQVRLLRVLQSREIERVGGTAPIALDIRIIAATNRDLEEMVERGEFRQDLWFRLNVFPILIPALRDRLMDLPELTAYFIERKAKEMNIHPVPVPAPGALADLSRHDWPGNVRELENLIERALILHITSPAGTPLRFPDLDSPEPSAPATPPPLPEDTSLNLDDAIRHQIHRALEATGGRVKGDKGAAALLGVNPSTLRNKMKKLGIPFGKSLNPDIS